MELEIEEKYVPHYEIWHSANMWQIRLFVIELNPGEIVRRRAMGEHERDYDLDPNRPWPTRQRDKLIWRRWDIGKTYPKGWQVAELFRKAENVKARLELGERLVPNYERRFKGDGNSKRNHKNDAGQK